MENHKDWVSCVRLLGKGSSKGSASNYFATVGWDGRLKIWNIMDLKFKDSFKAHESNINYLSVSPFGKFIATGGKDQKIYVWNFSNTKKPEHEFTANAPINQLAFHPTKDLIAVATDLGIQLFKISAEQEDVSQDDIMVQLQRKETKVEDKRVEKKVVIKHYQCMSITWDAVGKYLFAGFTDNVIRVYELRALDK